MSPAPLVSVLLAVHNGEPFVRAALASVLSQSVRDLELIVIDDGSSDGTPRILESVDDERVRIVRNDRQLGLASSLNRGLELALGPYVARMDADDIALPDWLRHTLALLRSQPELGVVGAGVVDLDEQGRPGAVHLLERSPAALRWRALFSSPLFHDTVVLDRAVLERHGLRYDESFEESEDYELWSRLLDVCEASCVEMPLVLHRIHPGQASRRRAALQRARAEDVSLRVIGALAPVLGPEGARLARAVALGTPLSEHDVRSAVDAYVVLLERFQESRILAPRDRAVVRRLAARALLRLARNAPARDVAYAVRRALVLEPSLPVHVVSRRSQRRAATRVAHAAATKLLRTLAPDRRPGTRVVVVSPEPTPYRAPLFDRIAARDDIDLTVVYAAETLASRTWSVEVRHRATTLRGVRVPGVGRLLAHEYVVSPDVGRVLRELEPEVVVVSGWSTFACQAAILWCRRRRIPYVLQVESHDEGPRAGWRRAVKGALVPRVVNGAAWVLVTGTLVQRSMLDRGAAPERMGLFAVTVDVEELGARADALRASRGALRSALGAGPDDVLVLSVARLASEKGLETLVRAVAAVADERLVLAVVGDGPERERLRALAHDVGARLVLAGERPWERVVEAYVAADLFALLSEREPWGVVVNEAAACGLPLVLSSRVGAAADLLHDGENGTLVEAGDVAGAAAAIRKLAERPDLRSRQGARSREVVAGWGYGPSVDGFVEAVRGAVRVGARR